jgi:NDP-sugar pyrophosphorylase family protein
MISIILAAGQGTRMRPLSYIIPKILLPVHGKPVLSYLLNNMNGLKIDKTYIVASEHIEQIQTYIDKTNMKNISVVNGLGWETGGDLSIALENINYVDDTIVLNGDIITDISLKKVYQDHRNVDPYLTIGIFNLKNTNEIKRFGSIYIDEHNMITNFIEKPESNNLGSTIVNSGFYILSKKIIEKRNKYLVPRKFKLEQELFPRLASEYKLYGSLCDLSYWWDVGTMESYLKAEQFFINNHNIIPP